MFIKICLVIIYLTLITVMFHFASGGLSIRRPDIIFITYWQFIIMVYIGAALCYLGLGKAHYIIKIIDYDVLAKTFHIVSIVGIIIPFIVIMLNLLAGNRDVSSSMEAYYTRTLHNELDQHLLDRWLVGLSFVGFLCTAYSFASIRNVPLIGVLLGRSADAAAARWQAKNAFAGNSYIRNIGMLTLVPLNSIASYLQYRISPNSQRKRRVLCNLALTFLALTYNLEKSPIVYHILYLYVIACMTSRDNNLPNVTLYGVISILLITGGYYITSKTLPTLSLTTGPISRMILTPIGTLALHFLIFPSIVPYLEGQSLPTLLASIIGLRSGWIRSGAVVMRIFNPKGIASNKAGVMNAFFIGEAYANWGYAGIVVATLLVGLFLGLCSLIITRREKTFSMILLTIVLMKFQVTSFLGGFVDYIYSISLLFSILYIFFCYSFCRKSRNEIESNKRLVTSRKMKRVHHP